MESSPESFQDFVRSSTGRLRLLRWMAGSGLVFAIGFGVFAWYAEAAVPILFWPIIAGGGALFGLHFFYLLWKVRAEKRANHPGA